MNDARASVSEHRSHGIGTAALSVTAMSASGVVSIAFANTGFVLPGTITSEILPAGGS